MGKNSASKARPSLKGVGSLPTYFTPAEALSPGLNTVVGDDKMAPASTDDPALTRQDLQDLGADLKSYFLSMFAQKLASISKQLTELSEALKEVSHMADTALDASIALQVKT